MDMKHRGIVKRLIVSSVAPLAILINGFGNFFLPNLELSKEKTILLFKTCLIYIDSLSKIDGFDEPAFQI